VQTRAYGRSLPDKRQALRLATLDSSIALMFALSINAAILVLAAATFHRNNLTGVAGIQDAYKLLQPLLGSAMAPILFAVALLASGLNSTVTATMAGQIVMEGFIDFRLKPWLRRLVTRAFAIVPAAAAIVIWGSAETGRLLILSQVVLSFQLPFAIVPLVQFTASREKMGDMVAPRWQSLAAWVIAAVVIALNLKLLFDLAMGTTHL